MVPSELTIMGLFEVAGEVVAVYALLLILVSGLAVGVYTVKLIIRQIQSAIGIRAIAGDPAYGSARDRRDRARAGVMSDNELAAHWESVYTMPQVDKINMLNKRGVDPHSAFVAFNRKRAAKHGSIPF